MGRTIQLIAAIAAFAVTGAPALVMAQSQGVPSTPRSSAQVDLTGYWVSLVTEDWRYRMSNPGAADIGSIPVNSSGWEAARKWVPAPRDERGEPCAAYGAPGIMRQPGRLHIQWQDDKTLRVDFDAGGQTRMLEFAGFLPPAGFGTSELPGSLASFRAPQGKLSRQGLSVAAWTRQDQAFGFELFGRKMTPPPTPGRHGALMVSTSGFLPGWLQKNGVPYGEHAVLTEFFDLLDLPDAGKMLVVTSIVEDAQYLSEPYVTSTHFMYEPDGSKWAVTPCRE